MKSKSSFQVNLKTGDYVLVNGQGDLSMTHKDWVGEYVVFEKITKAGLFMVSHPDRKNMRTSVPKRNISILKFNVDQPAPASDMIRITPSQGVEPSLSLGGATIL